MLGSYEGAVVDRAVAKAEPEYPELVPGTRLCYACKYEQMDDHTPCGVDGCRCPHCIQAGGAR